MNLIEQDKIGYQLPPKGILDLIDVEATPITYLNPTNEWIVLLPSPNMPSIEQLAEEELKLAGVRFKPQNFSTDRNVFFTHISIQKVESLEEKTVQGLPENVKISNLSWSPDGQKLMFTNTTLLGVELWVCNLKKAKAKKITDKYLNHVLPTIPYTWFTDSKTVLIKSVVKAKKPKTTVNPSPIIQENIGKTAPARTFQDLLKNATDEALFEYYTTTQLLLLDIKSGKTKPFGKAAMVKSISTSPDGNYVLISTIKKPFSYLFQMDRFPFDVDIYNKKGEKVINLAQIPLSDAIPIAFNAVRIGRRNFEWRSDKPATIYWVEAQDEGNPKIETKVRDTLFYWEAPFSGKPKKAIDFELRYDGIVWGEGDCAIAYESWWQNRRLITSKWQPDTLQNGKEILSDRSYEDRYTDPGEYETAKNDFGRHTLMRSKDKKYLYLKGEGASPEGNRPFIDQFNLETKETTRLWRSTPPLFEVPIKIMDAEKGITLIRKEDINTPPNYTIENYKNKEKQQLTHYKNPYKSLEGVKKEIIQYKRADGLELNGTLYLPPNYVPNGENRLPVLFWAYPREYKSSQAAGQLHDSPHTFTRPFWASPIYWVTQGFAVFDDFSVPIVGEDNAEPNETFIEQLKMDAEAAINKLVEMGVADAKRLAVGGHSYGAFMTANLLAHTDLFAAGIARSGAFNRTLTPFGFQAEERSLWEAPDVYANMSPFMFADKIKTPLLLIHGEADNNSGTFTMQSERFYQALKGHGATTRLVLLPYESHGYQARESILHMLYEMDIWLKRFLGA